MSEGFGGEPLGDVVAELAHHYSHNDQYDERADWQSSGLAEVVPEAPRSALPEDDAERNSFPMFDGLLAYFPNALAEVSRVSKVGNEQHNPGQPMHWARGKSTDHGNKIVRHLIDAGGSDARGIRHSARLAWRALALLQQEIEDAGAPMSRGSRAS